MGRFLPLAAIILLAFLLRFPSLAGNTQYVSGEFTRDIEILKNLHGGQMVSLGPKASLGDFHFGPAYYYSLYPLAWLLDFKVYSLALTSALFSTLTVLLSFFVVRLWWQSRSLAYLVSFILAISALDIQFAKYASNPNLIPFFTLLFFYCAQKIISDSYNAFHVLCAGLALGVACQLHVVPLVSLPLIVFILIIMRRWPLWISDWLLFLGAIILVNGPYIYYEATHNFANVHGLMNIGGSEGYYGTLLTHLLEYVRFWFSNWISIHHLFSIILLGGFGWLYVIVANIILLYGVYVHNRLHQSRNIGIMIRTASSVKLVLWLWFIIPSVFLIAAPGNVNQLLIYYFTMFLPLGAILIGLWMYKLYSRRLQTTATALLVSFVAWQLMQIILYTIHYPIW